MRRAIWDLLFTQYARPHTEILTAPQKNDANDAAAIHETLFRPGLRFVKVRSIANQAMLMQHKAREMLVAQ
ncbi:MAG: hypothetical protein K2W81_10860 [Sphingomonas sp.]|nr:hypothetical protein [Sphingomonas sp.]